MYIFLDESYNLKNRTKPQFISINGFAVLDERSLFKKWKEYRHPFVGKRRIHAIENFLKKRYSQTRIDFKLQPSSADILLEFADFISNIFYRAYVKEDTAFFENLQFKTIQIKNPLR